MNFKTTEKLAAEDLSKKPNFNVRASSSTGYRVESVILGSGNIRLQPRTLSIHPIKIADF